MLWQQPRMQTHKNASQGAAGAETRLEIRGLASLSTFPASRRYQAHRSWLGYIDNKAWEKDFPRLLHNKSSVGRSHRHGFLQWLVLPLLTPQSKLVHLFAILFKPGLQLLDSIHHHQFFAHR